MWSSQMAAKEQFCRAAAEIGMIWQGRPGQSQAAAYAAAERGLPAKARISVGEIGFGDHLGGLGRRNPFAPALAFFFPLVGDVVDLEGIDQNLAARAVAVGRAPWNSNSGRLRAPRSLP